MNERDEYRNIVEFVSERISSDRAARLVAAIIGALSADDDGRIYDEIIEGVGQHILTDGDAEWSSADVDCLLDWSVEEEQAMMRRVDVMEDQL